MNTQVIDKEIQKIYLQSTLDPKIITPYNVDSNNNLTVWVETYTSLKGNGFRVVGKMKESDKTYIRVLNYGPDISSNMDWQELLIPYTE